MKMTAKSGAALAAAAAIMIVNGLATVSPAEASHSVKCYGVNACKGHSACKTGASACKGQNACKGQGFEKHSKRACLAKGGKLTAA